MNRWLMKSEPDVFGIEDLAAAPQGTDRWDGVRNYQVRNMIRDHMRPGDVAFFYHSNTRPPGVVGLMEVVSDPYPDPTAFDPDDPHYDPKSTPEAPRWFCVDVRFRERLSRRVTLQELRECPELEGFPLIRRGNRLSIVPVTEAQWTAILRLADD
ncbi:MULTISPECIES: EVE domain-containing protein [Halorhodospira]|uniref:EVE domain-containing protein n=1 Tax=Halorhodospira TaxID=85108 RepID=UPI001EE8DA78|nr:MULTISPECIES: EVE domain-containing protein [Halorhodospira]MCG5527065.1 EVE domain-containing protein [Halorhodospira halophila]MCG5541294.1 EVE domain-containing protein [Halorhodospira sp. M39old]MCG5542598.1 EVE domain-containing protein [Halorhodospira sp. 9628]MCG5546512.1 EVE domain-containing protein [Halorhodospira sp. M38]